MTDLAGALAALAGAAGGASAPPAAARPPGPPSTSMPPELNLFAQLAAVSHLLQQAQGGDGAVPVAQGDLSAGTAPPPMVATPSVRVGPAGAAAALQHTGLPPPSDRPTRSGESGQGGRTTSSAYASRHQLAEQRRRNRINERLDRLRTLVPAFTGDRPNTAAFLERVADHILSLRARVRTLEAAAGVPPSLPPPSALPPLTGTLVGMGAAASCASAGTAAHVVGGGGSATATAMAQGLVALAAAAGQSQGGSGGGGGGALPTAEELQAAAMAILNAAAASHAAHQQAQAQAQAQAVQEEQAVQAAQQQPPGGVSVPVPSKPTPTPATGPSALLRAALAAGAAPTPAPAAPTSPGHESGAAVAQAPGAADPPLPKRARVKDGD